MKFNFAEKKAGSFLSNWSITSFTEIFSGHKSASRYEGLLTFQLLTYKEIPCVMASVKSSVLKASHVSLFLMRFLKCSWFTVQKRCDVRPNRKANANVRSWKHDHSFVTFCSWKAGFSTSLSANLGRSSHLRALPSIPSTTQRLKANVNNRPAT